MTASVTELMNSTETSVPYCSARKPWISRTVMPRTYMAMSLSSKPVKCRSCLSVQQRLEGAVGVTRHLDAHRAVLGQHGLGTGAVAMVGGILRLGRTGRVAQVARSSAPSARLMSAFLNASEAALTASVLIGPVTT